jgi:hypothetical protein
MADALSVGRVLLRSGTRQTEPRRFLDGFETAGWLALLSFGFCYLLAEGQAEAFIGGMFSMAQESVPPGAFGRGSVSIPVASLAMLLALLVLPQLIPALIASWLACYLKLHGASIPTRGAAAQSDTYFL